MAAQFCANRRVDVNIKDRSGSTPLHSAARVGSFMLTKILLEAGGDVHARDLQGLVPSDVAATEEISRLIEADPESDMSDDSQTDLTFLTKSMSRSYYEPSNSAHRQFNAKERYGKREISRVK